MAFGDWLKKYWPDMLSTALTGFPLFGAVGKGVAGLVNAADQNDNLVQDVNSSINDFNSAMSQDKLGYTESGVAYDRTNPDSIINAQNMENAYKRDDTAIDRMFEAYKRVGINPVLALTNSASVSNLASSASVGHYSQNANEQINSALKAGGILAIIIKMLTKL